MDIVYPGRCPVCDNVLNFGCRDYICHECADKIKFVEEPYCKKCGKPIMDENAEYCVDCQKKTFTYIYGRALFVYDRHMRRSIARFKYSGRREYARFYAKKLYERYNDWIQVIRPDAYIPIPVHRKRYNKRGYNQAEEIGDCLSELTDIPCMKNIVMRTKNTLPQKELSQIERKSNIEGAFFIKQASEEMCQKLECVIIIDDIYTTGSTIEECAKVLKNCGVNKIYFLCICIGSVI